MRYLDLVQRAPQHILMFGATKSGKSTLAALLAMKRKVIWLSLDGGHVVIGKLPLLAQENVDIIAIQDNKDNPLAQQTCRALITGKLVTVCHVHGHNNCESCKRLGQPVSSYEFNKLGADTVVVLDHATQLSLSYQNVVTKNKPDDYKLQLDDWGQLKYHLSAFFSFVQTAPFNIVVLAQMCEVETEDKNKRLFSDIGSSTFAPGAGQYFDHVVYTYIQQGKYLATSNSNFKPNIICGSRTDILIEKSESKDLDCFLQSAPLVATAAAESKAVLQNALVTKPAEIVQKQEQSASSALPEGTKEWVRALLAARRGVK